MSSWRVVLLFALNFFVGWLVSRGYIDQANHNDVVNGLADGVGYLIIGVTSIATIVHAFKHPHADMKQQPIATASVKTETKTEQVFTDAPVAAPALPSGTPPSPNEQ